jgi:hypothetical protein
MRLLLASLLLALPLSAAWLNASALHARRAPEASKTLFFDDPIALYRAARALGGEGKTLTPSAEAASLLDRALPIFGHKPVGARWRLLLADQAGAGMSEAARLVAEISRSPKAHPGRTLYAAGAALNAAGDEEAAFALFLRGLAFDGDAQGSNALALAHYAAVDGLEAMRWHFLTRALHAGAPPAALRAQAQRWAQDSLEAASFAEAFERQLSSGAGRK